VRINHILVLDVYKRSEVRDSRGDEGQTPERDELDEEVRDERGEESLPKFRLAWD
jgi:hypothetical protein